MWKLYTNFLNSLKTPSLAETLVDLILCAVPIWAAVMIGLVIGWSWRPRWTGILFLGLRGKFRLVLTAPPGLGARRIWLAVTALSAVSVVRRMLSKSKEKVGGAVENDNVDSSSSSSILGGEFEIVTEKDLNNLLQLLEGKVGNADWQNQMERITPNMSYQAWRYEPEVGPIIFRSRTVFEDATPELVRDFFWDDEFRPKWDHMLAYFKLLSEFPESGTTIVHWIKKFPFFCSDREYTIGRRIWECGKTFYCVTKGIQYPSLPKKEKPRRVEHYFSSWRIRAVESRKGDGHLSACEVILIHYEDMGIPKDVAKVGVRHGMWGAVKKLQSGMRAYQMMRKTEKSISRSALAAQITTKIPIDGTIDLLDDRNSSALEVTDDNDTKRQHGIDWKWIVIGGVAVVCALRRATRK